MAEELLDQLLDEASTSNDYYASHLAEVDVTNGVISTEDITTSQNISLVKKGTRITSEIAQRLLKHKLNKPLEQQVQIELCMGREELLNQFELLIKKYPDLGQIYTNSGYKKSFNQLIKSYIISPLLAQKLTVFSQQLPEQFEKTLFCTFLALNIAYKAKLDKNDLITTYLAGLSHDLGFLHISPEIFRYPDKLSEQQWRAIKSHVITGYMFINSIDINYRKDVATAVLEHHERCDGSGYPIGKGKQQLVIFGQIIGIADSLQAIRINQFEKVGRNLRDALPFLHMNPTTHSDKVYRAAVSVLKDIPATQDPAIRFEKPEDFITHLISRENQLSNVSLIIQLLLHLSNELGLHKSGLALLNIIKPIDKMIRQSGLVEGDIVIWLEHIKKTADYNSMSELCELELMQNELYWQIQKTKSTYITLLELETISFSQDTIQHLNTIIAEIDDIL